MIRKDETELVISGLPLSNPQVGIGVYTIRLIQGLLRAPNAPRFKIVVPEPLSGIARALFPREIIHSFSVGRGTNQALLNQLTWNARLAREVSLRFPHALFHSPGIIWSPWRSKRTAVTLHDCIYRHFPLYCGRLWLRRTMLLLGERYARNSTLILTVSEFSKKELVEFVRVPAEKIHVLYNWVGEEFLTPPTQEVVDAVRAKYRLPEKFWLYLGGFDYRKNIEFLLNAYAKARTLSAEIPTLVLAGKTPPLGSVAPYSDPIGVAQKLGLNENQVVLPGMIADGDVPALYRAAALLIYPSLYEGFGLPAAEAMAVGTPILVSDATSLPEVVNRVECRFDPASETQLVEKLLVAAAHPSAFVCEFPDCFREGPAIARYLEIIQAHRHSL